MLNDKIVQSEIESNSISTKTNNEITGQIMAERSRADLESRMTMALHRPRNIETVRAKLLAACERPGFAGSAFESVYGAAWYDLKFAKNVAGFSIRFAEEAMRALGNIEASTTIIYDDELKRIIEIRVMDLESNISLPRQLILNKTKEKSQLKKGEIPISQRMNTNNDVVYLVPATDADMLKSQNANISRAIRNEILRLLPGDIQTQCRERILEIRRGDVPKDPSAQKRRIIDSYSELGVQVDSLEKLLGHDIGGCSPGELDMLRNLYMAIKNEYTTFWDELSEVEKMRADEDEQRPESNIERLKNRLSNMAPDTETSGTSRTENAEDEDK